MKVYFFRHQAAGVVWEFPFSAEPAPEVQSRVAQILARRHGEKHPKTGEPYWLTVVAINVLGPTEEPVLPEVGISASSVAGAGAGGAGAVSVSGIGRVENP